MFELFLYSSLTFMQQHDSLIKSVKQDIEFNCNKKIRKKITYEWMPKKLDEFYLKSEYARVNFVADGVWIEFSKRFNDLNYRDQKYLIYHEIGHAYGLLHGDNGIMKSGVSNVYPDFKEYYKDLCKNL